MNSKQMVAVAKSMVETWDNSSVTCEKKGDRLFIRWVDYNPAYASFLDWKLRGTIDDTKITWLCEEQPYFEDIQKSVNSGLIYGRMRISETVIVWWCRSKLDGPPEERLSEWINNAEI